MTKFKTIILWVLMAGLIGCGRSESSVDETSTETQPKIVTSERSKPTENSKSSPESPDKQTPQATVKSPDQLTPQSSDQKAETPESNSPTPSPTSPPKSEDSPTEIRKTDRPLTQTDYDFKPDEEPIVPVGNFEFQLKQASLKKELIDPSTQKSYSAKSAEKPSYYLFVELDLTNRSDRTAFDLFRYQLDCGDGKPIENAADAAVAYRSNQNLNVFAEIKPGETGTVADGFLVPESCLNSDQMTLNISSAGEGKGDIPLRLK
jgi:hypothetical protein